jgi:hypothetical protein
MKPWSVAVCVGALTVISFFEFPGHTWLQQDSQIYVPILEHLRDPAVLRNDPLVERPHVSFTLYDEAALLLRALTGRSFHEGLALQQVATRGAGIWGLYLMATAAGLSAWPAMLAAAIVSLGSVIVGPSVLLFEYEPIPRGFAVPLLFCGIGLAAHRRHLLAGVSGAAAFLVHPPTVYPFWLVYAVMRKARAFVPLAAAAAILLVASLFQSGSGEEQVFFARLTPLQEKLQRMRASYVWISSWGLALLPHYLIVYAVSLAAYFRIRSRTAPELRAFLLGLPLLGMLSMPLSYLLLERAGWALIPQLQPMRALLFVTLAMQFSTAVAAISAAGKQRHLEAFGWFAAAYWIPLMQRTDVLPEWRRVAVVLLLAAIAVAASFVRSPWRRVAIGGAALLGFFAVPRLGGVVNYPRLHGPELKQLSGWALASTPRDSVFLFPDAGRALYPGIFRSEALRAVYVDWKGGGQVNYLKELGEEWWRRWQQTMAPGFRTADLRTYRELGVQYVVVQAKNRVAGRSPVFDNGSFVAYETSP